MRIAVKFSETDQSIKADFGEVYNISDGGFERGYAAGYEQGDIDGQIKGKAEGEQIGYDNAIAKQTALEVTANGEYLPQGDSVGFSSVSVNVQFQNKLPQVIDRTVTEITAEDLAGATNIAQYAFYNRLNLKSVTIPEGVKAIYNSAFNMSYNIASINILSTVLTMIDSSAFGYIYNTKEINLPDSVKTIGYGVFYQNSGLKRVSIGSGITKIDSSAFYNCGSLMEIIVLAEEPPTIQSNTFNGVPENCIIKVRASSVDKYKTATNWSARADYIIAKTE